jgi:predicted nucleotidyltransferase
MTLSLDEASQMIQRRASQASNSEKLNWGSTHPLGRVDMNEYVMKVVKSFSQRLIKRGAEAIVVFGSWVRGDAYKDSDIDIRIMGKGGPPYRLHRYKDLLISISWTTLNQERRAFRNPSKIGGVVPAWRNAVILYDPNGTAETLQKEARDWRWEIITDKAERWIAEELTGFAEEVHKLVGNMQLKRKKAVSVQRYLLAIYIAPLLATYHRIFYDSENQLRDMVSAKMGYKWNKTQSTAFGEDGSSFEEGCQAALRLFSLTAEETKHLLNRRQYEVVAYACKIAGYPIEKE